MNKILFVTSFNEELYKASGKYLFDSFFKYKWQECSDLFIGIEEWKLNQYLNCIQYNLDNDSFLQNWLKENKDIIPTYLGGLAVPCKCRNPFGRRDRDHKKGCYFSWWNRNCSRWFRKIACLNQLVSNDNYKQYDWFIWLDADVIFKRSLDDNFILPNHGDIFYMRGKSRRAVETGIFGMKNNLMGRTFINQLTYEYAGTSFRELDRWDDGYIFKVALGQFKSKGDTLKAIDIAENCRSTEVANYTILSPYLQHNKGTHGQKLNIMK